MSEYRYLFGRRYRLNAENVWEYCPPRSQFFTGRYGVKMVSFRVPVDIVPFLQAILDKLEEIETFRRNLEGNVLNTSTEFLVDNEDFLKSMTYILTKGKVDDKERNLRSSDKKGAGASEKTEHSKEKTGRRRG